ncbi:Arylsulfatase [Fuerstiella marisgermanici]|uniref:Arylsulfatase n=2 Tax=Fuerstiella marisgermanici TaxID=1891926 RepID=A0A1P8WQ45_9PLAN|nr:Arylsulfatase [Fuerstiella marisgermanici]
MIHWENIQKVARPMSSQSFRQCRQPARSTILSGTIATFALAFCAASFCVANDRQASRPNVILIMADDLGFSDLGCYGGEIDTPNIDRLAEQGMKFSQFYNCAVCRTSRVSLLTGLHPRRIKGRMLHDNMTTLGEVAQSAGYRTSLIGKWHFPVTKPMDKSRLPTRRGFERFYGLAAGCCNYFNPAMPFPKFYRGQGPDPFLEQETPVTQFPPDYYSTDAFTDRAVQQIEEFSQAADKPPFFLHLCYTAPHYPLHAKPHDIAKYEGRFDDGYFKIRENRLKRLKELGLVDPKWKLSAPDVSQGKLAYDYAVTPWDQIENLPRERRRMEVYAAMVDSMDQGIGRVLAAIESAGIADNTCVMFLSDNGGCASHSGYHDGEIREQHETYNKELPGSVNTYDYVAQGWGWAQNAPFRRHKVWTHEGGISTPLIVRWPKVVSPGVLSHQVGHVVDIMPTLLEISGAPYPEQRNEVAVLPIEGLSLLPVFQGKERAGHPSLSWYLYGNRAVRQGKWKLVWGSNVRKWELFDMELDRTETNDLASQYPQRVKQMETDWLRWAKKTNAPLKGTSL